MPKQKKMYGNEAAAIKAVAKPAGPPKNSLMKKANASAIPKKPRKAKTMEQFMKERN